MTTDRCAKLDITMSIHCINEFSPLLQEGVQLSVQTGCTLADLLGDQLGLDREYISSRITTVFIDSRPVDDMKTARIHNGAVIALSGAMPGLVGATMRSGGFYAALRGGISYVADTGTDTDRQGRVRIKLFNLLLSEVGPVLLQQGVAIPTVRLRDFLTSRTDSFWSGCIEVSLNGATVERYRLTEDDYLTPYDDVCLGVTFRERP